MDFLYGVLPAVILVVGTLVAVLCFRRVASLGRRTFGAFRKLAEGIVLSVVGLLALILGLSSSVNAVILHHYRAQMPGRLYAVDGHRMRLDCTGSGAPTLILDAGHGNDGLIFSAVQPVLAQTTRVCSYDRAGMGWSDPVPTPRDADHIAEQLHGLLQTAGVTGPIVLMGHSIAGLYIRDYASRYPSQVAGLVFIDASTPLQNRDPALRPAEPARQSAWDDWATQAISVLGIPRWSGLCSMPFPFFPPARAKLMIEERCHLVQSSVAGEMGEFDRSGEETVHTGPYGDLPVLIFTSDPQQAASEHEAPDVRAAWDRMQANLKNLSTRSRQVIAARSGHYVQLERPELVDREVTQFIQQIRGAAPWPAGWTATVRE